MGVARKFGFNRLEVCRCPQATPFAEAIERGWFAEIKVGHERLLEITTEIQLIPVLEKLGYHYLAERVVTQKGATQLAAEWRATLREQDKIRKRKNRDPKNRHKNLMRKSHARKKSEILPTLGNQDPEPLGG